MSRLLSAFERRERRDLSAGAALFVALVIWLFPAAMARAKLSNRVGAGMDPCGAIQIPCELADGQAREGGGKLVATTHTWSR